MRNATDTQDHPPSRDATTTSAPSSTSVSADILEHPTNNLPHLVSSFIGRERELVELKRLLSTHRLLTLTGPGGSGKTRLAIQSASQVLDAFADGVWWVELAALADESLVPQAIAQTLGVREAPNEPPSETLINALRSKHLLVVVDNCEHLITACAQLTDKLLQACPHLTILATSREPLAIAGETVYQVSTLSLPHRNNDLTVQLLQSEAVRLFVERARAVKPDFSLTEQNGHVVVQICQRLDGMPLALELAAARVKVLTVEHIAARLDDRFNLLTTGSRTALPRHQTLRATIDWSYDLLPEEARLLFRRLAVFAGGFTLDAAEAVGTMQEAGGSHQGRQPTAYRRPNSVWELPTQILDLLARLVDRSLVIVDMADHDERYHMLETIREYARERLEENGEAEAVRQRHAEFFLELAERLPPVMTGDERRARYIRFDAEQDNLRAAMSWALATHHVELGLRLVGALGEYWFWWASRWHEGWSWISQFLGLPEAVQCKHARANALKFAVNLVRYRGDTLEANRLADESLSLFRALGDQSGMAWVLVDKGTDAFTRGELREAEIFCRESVSLFREVGDQRGLGWALNWLANAVRSQGRVEEAAALFEQGIAAGQAGGDDAMLGMTYLGLAVLTHGRGDYARAAALHEQAIAFMRQGGDADGVNYARSGLAHSLLVQGDLDRAASEYETVEAWFRQAQQQLGLASMLHQLGYVRHLQGDDRGAAELFREAMMLQQQQQLKANLVETLERCAWVLADTHQAQRAARLLGAVEAAHEQLGARLLGDQIFHDRHVERARSELDQATFDAAWGEGRALTLEQASQYALVEIDHLAAAPAATPPKQERVGGLTAREREVAARIAQGESNREIAQELVVTERTVESHVTNILNKLGFTSRAEIRKWAIERGLTKT